MSINERDHVNVLSDMEISHCRFALYLFIDLSAALDNHIYD